MSRRPLPHRFSSCLLALFVALVAPAVLAQATSLDQARRQIEKTGAALEELNDAAALQGARDSTLKIQAQAEKTIAERFTGRIEQVPNSYSAIKINGQRAYDLAREGKDVDLKARPVTISEFHVSAVRYGYASSARGCSYDGI